MRILKSRWFYALLGALLIIIGTAVTGIWAYQQDITAANIQRQLANLSESLHKSEADETSAKSSFNAAVLLRSVVKFSIFQDPDIQKQWDAVEAVELYNSVLASHTAAGKEFDDDLPAEIGIRNGQGQDRQDKASSGHSQDDLRLLGHWRHAHSIGAHGGKGQKQKPARA